MAIRNVYLDDKLSVAWNDDTSIVTFYNPNGTVQNSRAYTAAERTAIDAMLARNAAGTNQRTVQQALAADLVTWQTHLAKTNAVLNSEFNANPAAMLKEIYRGLRRLDRVALGDYTGSD